MPQGVPLTIGSQLREESSPALPPTCSLAAGNRWMEMTEVLIDFGLITTREPRVPSQVDQQPGCDFVEPADVAEGEGPQERPEGRRSPSSLEQPAHRAGPQQRHVLDAVGAGDHPRDQMRTFSFAIIDARQLLEVNMLADQRLQTSSLGELQHRRQPGARHQIRVGERGGEAVTDSPLADALFAG